jgi:phosphatidylglycerol lysyltransferase
MTGQKPLSAEPTDAVHNSDDAPAVPSPAVKALHWALPTIALALVAVAVWHELGQLDLHAVRHAFQRLSLGVTLLLLAGGLAAFSLNTLYDGLISRWLGLPVNLSYVVRYAWLAAALNNVIGFLGMSGSTVRYLALTRAGTDPKSAMADVGLNITSLPVGLSVLATLVLLLHRDLLAQPGLPTGIVLTALAGMSLYWPLYLVLAGRGLLHRRFLADTPSLAITQRFGLLAVSSVDWLVVGLLLFACLHAVGISVTPTSSVAAFAVAQTLGFLSLVPGGLGVFEGTMLLLLDRSGGVTANLVTALLLFRTVYYFAPFVLAAQLLPGLRLGPEGGSSDELIRLFKSHPLLRFGRLPLRLVAQTATRILAYAIFSAGALLLVTAAFPAVTPHLAIVDPYLPWPLREGFHLSSVLAGTLLLGLSRGIRAGVRNAYGTTQIVLLLGALLVLLRGLDLEESLLLLTLSFLLRTSRHRFTRRGYSLTSARSLSWLAAATITMALVALLGAALYGTSSLPAGMNDVAYAEHAARFVRTLLVMFLSLLAWLAWTWYAMPSPALQRPGGEALRKATRFYRDIAATRYSYLSLLGDKYLHFADDGRTLVQYGLRRHHLITLGDPACPQEQLPQALQDLRRFADDYDLTPVLYQVEESNLHHYHEAGFRLLKLGESACVELSKFDLEGKTGAKYRTVINRAGRDQLSFEILQQPLNEETWRQLRAVSDAWLSDRGMAEIGFSLGYFDPSFLAWFPIAVVKQNGRFIAFANLVDDFGHSDQCGIDLMRHLPDTPHGTMDFLFISLFQYAKQHGYRWFDLGMAPLSGVGDSPWAPGDERLLKLVFEFGNRFYNYKGLRNYKEKFRPQWSGMYLAYPRGHTLAPILFDVTVLITGGYWRALRRKAATMRWQ